MNIMYKERRGKPMSSTKLIVLKSKELIYTAILVALVITFIVIMIYMFRHKGSSKADAKNSSKSVTASAEAERSTDIHYTPGTYQATMNLGENSLTLLVTVDENYITDVTFKQLNETVTTMYPLLETALLDINTQLHYVSSVDDITPDSESNYTTLLIVSTIRAALENAMVN